MERQRKTNHIVTEKLAPDAELRSRGLRNRLLARIFTVDILRRREHNTSGQVSQLSYSHISSRFRLGMKETCEERL